MTKAILERSMAIELTDHLGYEEGDPAGNGSGNSRNGTTAKRLMTEAGHLGLEVPRDRNGNFTPQTVKKGQRRLDGVDKLVMGLYARGMTVRDMQPSLRRRSTWTSPTTSSARSPTGSCRKSRSGSTGPRTPDIDVSG